MLYSLVFTSVPVILLGVFDQDVDATTSLAYPLLYKRGMAGLEYTKSIFWAFMLDGIYQSVSLPFVR
jgi:phospholipid-translocating ATPase